MVDHILTGGCQAAPLAESRFKGKVAVIRNDREPPGICTKVLSTPKLV